MLGNYTRKLCDVRKLCDARKLHDNRKLRRVALLGCYARKLHNIT